MKSTSIAPTAQPQHSGGWTLERRVQFLRCLAEKGDVRGACAEVGLSRQSVYKLRRRKPDFARIWSAAMEVARDKRASRMVAALLERKGGIPLSRSCHPTWRSVARAPAGGIESHARVWNSQNER